MKENIFISFERLHGRTEYNAFYKKYGGVMYTNATSATICSASATLLFEKMVITIWLAIPLYKVADGDFHKWVLAYIFRIRLAHNTNKLSEKIFKKPH